MERTKKIKNHSIPAFVVEHQKVAPLIHSYEKNTTANIGDDLIRWRMYVQWTCGCTRLPNVSREFLFNAAGRYYRYNPNLDKFMTYNPECPCWKCQSQKPTGPGHIEPQQQTKE